MRKGIIDGFTSIDDILIENTRLLKSLNTLLTKEEERKTEIVSFTYPADGSGTVSLSTGTTVLNYQFGTIKTPAGIISEMTHSLKSKPGEFIRSYHISTDQNIAVQIDGKDWVYIEADEKVTATYLQCRQISIKTTTSTNIFLLASTSPENLLFFLKNDTTPTNYLIDMKATSSYYKDKTASLYYSSGSYTGNKWWSWACRGTTGTTEVTDYLTLDLTALTSDMSNPILRVDYLYEIHDFDFANDYGWGSLSVCKNDNSLIAEAPAYFEKNIQYVERYFHVYADITSEKNNLIKLRFNEKVSLNGVGTICSIVYVHPYAQLFELES